LHRARAALRKQLVQTCGSCAEHGCLNCICRKHKGHQFSGGSA
jgi:RNA polymerase sigma-70 factor (ECF subfamily)